MSEILIQIPRISLEEQKRYRGKDVAIVDGRVVAVGNSSVEVFKKARRLYPGKKPAEIILASVPEPEVLIL